MEEALLRPCSARGWWGYISAVLRVAGQHFAGGKEQVISVVLEKNLRGMPSLDNCLDLCDSLYLLGRARLTLDSKFDSSGYFYSLQQSRNTSGRMCFLVCMEHPHLHFLSQEKKKSGSADSVD